MHDDRVISVAFEVKGEMIYPRMQVCILARLHA